MQNLKLRDHKGCQCHVIIRDDGVINFISYNTLVIVATPHSVANLADDRDIKVKSNETLDDTCYFLECSGTYSRTTARQISYFLREYFPTIEYCDMKAAAREDMYFVAHRKDV